MEILTASGIDELIEKKRAGETIESKFIPLVKHYFSVKFTYMMNRRFLPDWDSLRNLINTFDEAYGFLEFPLDEFKHARNCLDKFLQLSQANWLFMIADMKKGGEDDRTTD